MDESGEGISIVDKESEYKSQLDSAIQVFRDGFIGLSADPAKYIIEGKQLAHRQSDVVRIQNAAQYFETLKGKRLEKFLQFADQLGIPLSPIGMFTFNSGAFAEMASKTTGIIGSTEGGTYASKDKFKTGPSNEAGLWLVTIPSAQDQIKEDLRRAGDKVIWTYNTFKPSFRESEYMDLAGAHEGLHGINNFLPLSKLHYYAEIFNNRTVVLSNYIKPEKFKELLIEGYYRRANPDELKTINELFDIAFKSMNSGYQSEITWRMLLAPDVETFIKPTDPLNSAVSRMVQHNREIVLPKFRRALTK